MTVSTRLHSIPDSLKQHRRWVLWRYENRNGKRTKVPFSPHLGPADERFARARSNAPRTWGTFSDVCRHLPHVDGIGFMLGAGFAGVDLDKVRDPASGRLLPWAEKVVGKLDTYAEVSPSATGVKLLVRADKPAGRCVWTGWASHGGGKDGRIEIYGGGRFFTVTGHHVAGTPDEVRDRQAEIDLLCDGLGGGAVSRAATPPPPPPDPNAADDGIVKRAAHGPAGERFVRLWMGDTSDYDGDASRADLALCSLLAPHTGPDPERIDRVFRRSRLYRDKWDRDDYRRRTIEKALTAGTAGNGSSPPGTHDAGEPGECDRQADQLVALGRGCELWHDPAKIGYATPPGGGNLRLNSAEFRRWLITGFLGRHRRSPGRSAVDEAVATLDALAVCQGPQHPTFLRVARLADAICIDLGDATWDAVVVNPDGWRVGPSPVRFVRPAPLGPLPRPVPGGSVELLRRHVNVPPEDFPLVVGSVLDALKGHGPYLASVVVGEQGAAKSTLCRVIKKLLDPAPEGTDELDKVPPDERELGIAGNAGFVLAYDNISTLPQWLSDAFCRVSTGGSIKARRLHTDSEQVVFSVCRPLVLNGIAEFATSADLLSRAVLITAEWIPEDERVDEAAFWERFLADRPAILGAVYDALAQGLRSHRGVRLARKPRMAGTATWLAACLPALGWCYDDWLVPYSASQEAATDIGLETSPVGTAVFRWWQTENAFQPWAGTATELAGLVRPFCDEAQLRYWPVNPKTFADRLRRVIPCLRSRRVRVEFRRTNNARLITVSPVEAGDAAVTQDEPVVTQDDARTTRVTRHDSAPGTPYGLNADADSPPVTHGDAGDDGCVTAVQGRNWEPNCFKSEEIGPYAGDGDEDGDAGDAAFSLLEEEWGQEAPPHLRGGADAGTGGDASPASPASWAGNPGLLGESRHAGDVVTLPDLPVSARLVGYFPKSRHWTVEVDLGDDGPEPLPTDWRAAVYQLPMFRQSRPELWRAGVTPEGRPLLSGSSI